MLGGWLLPVPSPSQPLTLEYPQLPWPLETECCRSGCSIQGCCPVAHFMTQSPQELTAGILTQSVLLRALQVFQFW